MTKDTDQDAGPDDSSDDKELMEVFRAWEEEGRRPGSVEPPPEHDLDIAYVNARRARYSRALVFAALSVLCGFAIWVGRAEIGYFLSSSEPIDLGDLALRYADGETEIELPDNRYVTAKGLIMTQISEAGHKTYFLDPLYDIIVRTERELPDKPVRTSAYVEVDGAYQPILANRLAFPHDLTVFFEAEGRLVRLGAPPEQLRGELKKVSAHYSRVINGQPEDAYILYESEDPSSYLWYVAAMLLAIALIGLSGWIYWKSYQFEQSLKRRIQARATS